MRTPIALSLVMAVGTLAPACGGKSTVATKPDAAPPIGLAALAEIAAAVPDLPVVAIGGIARGNAGDVARAGAPLRRPLGDDDYVTVTWTPDAPQDAELADAGDRRRQRLLRLLSQAAGQGAAPTVDDLARALAAGVATVKRDLAVLRRQGRPVKTRGSPA